ncbi:Uncharacterized conserved protein YndB, AHSA1/START domain [Actinacidiphila yanglinensis]|uniref:Uncharacterized conserved protein YndB, AHSA1/START domain n=1 Tax=Actinacidiphila yanglinensis TaxID=310779 RepID=A0A1H6CBD7_9ACTN|nr:Uncharacterized conserved protein YndB, AHSA1/START domain [Actinacidiphila yanglinensis]
MPCVSTNVFVRRTPTEVFDFLADARNLALWSSGVASVESAYVRPGGNAVYRYRYPGRRRPYHLVCADYEPGRRIAFRGQRMWCPLGTQVPLYAFELLPHADGTLVRLSVTSSLSAALLLLAPLVAMAWRRDLPADSLKFRDLLGEGRTTGEALPAASSEVVPSVGAGANAGAGGPGAGPVPGTDAAPAGAPENVPSVPAATPMRTSATPHGFDYAH